MIKRFDTLIHTIQTSSCGRRVKEDTGRTIQWRTKLHQAISLCVGLVKNKNDVVYMLGFLIILRIEHNANFTLH